MGLGEGDIAVNDAGESKTTREDWLRATFGDQVVSGPPLSEGIGGPHAVC